MQNELPAKNQLEFLSDEFGFFFHFGIRTFNEEHRDWDMLPMDPASFAPTELDCDQWIRTVKAVGGKYAVMTTKHHDGFALWPSAYTAYSVKASPWKDGKGDVVREFTDACRRHGIKPCLYYSCAQFDTTDMAEGYDDFVIGQITELLTDYGDIHVLWFDANGSQGHSFDRERIARTIRSLQPDILCFGGFDNAHCIRWVGNEWGYAPFESTNQSEYGFAPIEADCCMTRYDWENFWFYNERHNDCRRTVDELIGMYYYTVGRGCNLLLNVAPDRRGLLQEEDVRLLCAMRDELSRRMHACALMPEKVTRLERDGKTVYRLDMPIPMLVDHVVLQEDISCGERIRAYSVNGKCTKGAAEGITLFSGRCVGHKRICTFPPFRAKCLEIVLTDAEPDAALLDPVALYVGSAGLEPRAVRG